MAENIKVVRLLKNRIYPTFQLFAEMANEKTKPSDGLLIAASTTVEWIKNRLGEDAPAELTDPMRPFYCSNGYVINIVSLPDEGVWTVQITEPDLGGDPGAKEQKRPAVPGRIIETNIGFYIKENKLQCGFQINISDPEGSDLAEVYRLGIVRQLCYNKDFGLTQIIPLVHEFQTVENQSQFKNMMKIIKDMDNQLPTVIFTQPTNDLPKPKTGISIGLDMSKLGAIDSSVKFNAFTDLPYDIKTFSKYGIGLCRTYLVKGLDTSLSENFKEYKTAGDILVVTPKKDKNKVSVFPYEKVPSKQEELMKKVTDFAYNYQREKTVDFQNVVFLSDAREQLLNQSAEQVPLDDMVDKATVAKLMSEYQQNLNEKDAEIERLRNKISDRDNTIVELKEQNKENQKLNEADIEKLNGKILALEKKLEYEKRKELLPKTHEEISKWVEKNFSGRLILHDKAKKLLESPDAKQVDVELICNALEYLAFEYYDCRYNGLSEDEKNMICSDKYGRTFEVTYQTSNLIEAMPAAYKIKYFKNPNTGKLRESPLDYHLKSGVKSQFLIRVYFLHDDDKKLLVVGSLPNHLPTLSNKT